MRLRELPEQSAGELLELPNNERTRSSTTTRLQELAELLEQADYENYHNY